MCILLDLYPSYFSLEDANISGIVFFKFQISLTNFWYMGKHLTYILTLYPATLLLSCINSGGFCCRFFGIFWLDHAVFYKDYFVFSFPICIPFILFSCFIALGRTSSTMLIRTGEWRNSCLVPNLSEKTFI